MVKLHEVPRGSRIALGTCDGAMELEFDHIDGMFSFCTDKDGGIHHVSAFQEVRIVREGPKRPAINWSYSVRGVNKKDPAKYHLTLGEGAYEREWTMCSLFFAPGKAKYYTEYQTPVGRVCGNCMRAYVAKRRKAR